LVYLVYILIIKIIVFFEGLVKLYL